MFRRMRKRSTLRAETLSRTPSVGTASRKLSSGTVLGAPRGKATDWGRLGVSPQELAADCTAMLPVELLRIPAADTAAAGVEETAGGVDLLLMRRRIGPAFAGKLG